MVLCHTVVDLAGSNVLLDLLVQFEVVFARQDFDLGTGFLFPFRDDGVQRFILCATDQLYFQRITFELLRLNTGAGHCEQPCSQRNRCAGRGRPLPMIFLLHVDLSWLKVHAHNGVPPEALETYAASTKTMVRRTSCTSVSRAGSSPEENRCRLLIGPMNASGNQLPVSIRFFQSWPRSFTCTVSGRPSG